MSELAHLTLEDLLRLVRALGAGPVRDVGLLDAAAARPLSTVFGEDAYPTLGLKAAALMHSLAKSHPFWSMATRGSPGSRRWCSSTSTAARPARPDDDAFELVVDLAGQRARRRGDRAAP